MDNHWKPLIVFGYATLRLYLICLELALFALAWWNYPFLNFFVSSTILLKYVRKLLLNCSSTVSAFGTRFEAVSEVNCCLSTEQCNCIETTAIMLVDTFCNCFTSNTTIWRYWLYQGKNTHTKAGSVFVTRECSTSTLLLLLVWCSFLLT